jgi:hypothetical protein
MGCFGACVVACSTPNNDSNSGSTNVFNGDTVSQYHDATTIVIINASCLQ